MDTESSRAVVRQFLSRTAQGDVDGAFALLADNAVWSNIGSTRFSGDFSGKAAIMEELIGPLFAGLQNGIKSEVLAVLADGDRVVVLSEGKSTTTDGVAYNNTYAQVFTVAGGKIIGVREYMDTALVDRVFGSA